MINPLALPSTSAPASATQRRAQRVLIAAGAALSLAFACTPPAAETTQTSDEAETEAGSQPATAPATQSSGGTQTEHETNDQGVPVDLAAGATGHYGAPFSVTTEPLTLSAAIDTCLDTGETCKVEADVLSACQAMGCWFTLEAQGVSDRPVRVVMADYGFFVPKNAGDCHATLEGTLETKTLTQAQAQHYANDAAAEGATPRTVEGPEAAYVWTITGATLERAVEL